jgi:LCP family protein required for cell wall assembly
MKINKQLIIFLFILAVGVIGYSIIPSFEREEFNAELVEDISSGNITTTTLETTENENSSEEPADEVSEEIFEYDIYDNLLINNSSKRIDNFFTSYLIIGTDERSENSSASRGIAQGSRADVILIVMVDDQSKVSMVSLPRDLLIEDPCTKNIQRINSSFAKNGCGSSAENLSAVILNITGLKIDHFVKFTFEGFEKIIDSLNGVEICVNETQREGYSFELQEGCNLVKGEIALNWIVSRNTEILDGEKLIDVNGASKTIDKNLYLVPNSTAAPDPSDSPYITNSLNLNSVLFLIHFNTASASLYKFFSVGFPLLPPKPLQETKSTLQFFSIYLWIL